MADNFIECIRRYDNETVFPDGHRVPYRMSEATADMYWTKRKAAPTQAEPTDWPVCGCSDVIYCGNPECGNTRVKCKPDGDVVERDLSKLRKSILREIEYEESVAASNRREAEKYKNKGEYSTMHKVNDLAASQEYQANKYRKFLTLLDEAALHAPNDTKPPESKICGKQIILKEVPAEGRGKFEEWAKANRLGLARRSDKPDEYAFCAQKTWLLWQHLQARPTTQDTEEAESTTNGENWREEAIAELQRKAYYDGFADCDACEPGKFPESTLKHCWEKSRTNRKNQHLYRKEVPLEEAVMVAVSKDENCDNEAIIRAALNTLSADGMRVCK